MADLFRLDGKVALVAGASRGLGLAMARGLAEHGADVALVARGREALEAAVGGLKATGRRAWAFPFDLSNVDGIPALFESISAATVGVDILVNCAGMHRRAPAERLSLQDWQEVLNLNLTAAFALCQAFAKARIAAGKPGKIINIGSLMCQAARPTTSAYTASKGGVLQLTKALAVDWAKHRINVNAIGPGYFQTELTKPLWQDPKFDEWVKSRTPLGRWGQPDDLIGAAVFLASPASDYMTGQILYVDGGWLANL
ncbi:MAG: SDR family oxidoreductase [Planctomycetes bacterium]|nr:SDR family oxidoreductase [Planctomycetota bacterium]